MITPCLSGVMRCVHAVYNYRIHHLLALFLNYIYSLWISFEFRSVGKHVIVYRLSQLRGGKYMTIGSDTVIGRHAVLTAWNRYDGRQYMPQVTIGSGCDFGEYLHLSCVRQITIGNGVLTGRWVTIIDNAHGQTVYDQLQQPPARRPVYVKGPVAIEDNVWIGDKVTILSGVTIGKGAVVAANSVVTHDVPAYSVAAGCPAKVIKQVEA